MILVDMSRWEIVHHHCKTKQKQWSHPLKLFLKSCQFFRNLYWKLAWQTLNLTLAYLDFFVLSFHISLNFALHVILLCTNLHFLKAILSPAGCLLNDVVNNEVSIKIFSVHYLFYCLLVLDVLSAAWQCIPNHSSGERTPTSNHTPTY